MRARALITTLAILTVTALPTFAATHLVEADGSGDFATIQAAVDAAADQDVIELGDGVFSGDGNRDVTIIGKSLTITSKSRDAGVCILDAEGNAASEHFIFQGESVGDDIVTISHLTLTNAWRPGGRITRAGGAIVNGGAQMVITDCVFRSNHAGYGGAVALGAGTHLIDSCVFEDNIAGVEGGAIYLNLGELTLQNSVLGRNIATLGGAIFCMEGRCDTEQCTLAGNMVTDPTSGAIHARTASFVDLRHSIVAFNTGMAATCLTDSGVAASCSDIYGNSSGDYVDCLTGQDGMLGNISADPWFCAPESGDYALADDSPCIPENNPDCGLIGALPPGCAIATSVVVLPDGTGDYVTIQQAVDSVVSSAVILLGDGVFTGPGNRDIDFDRKPLRIASLSGDPTACVIDCEQAGFGFLIEDLPYGATLEGFTIANGAGVTGGAVQVRDATVIFRDCVFADCSAGDRGGALYLYGADVTVEGCVLVGNHANVNGGGVFALGTTAAIDHCTFYANAAGGLAGGVWSNLSTLTLANTIVAGSLAGDGVHWNEGDIPQLICCNLFGNADGDWVGGIAPQQGFNGNIAADPYFCDPEARDFHLHDTSPCAPESSGACGLIGALPVGCITVSVVSPVPAQHEPMACDDTATFAFRCTPATNIAGLRSYSVRIAATEQVVFDADDITVATLPPGAESFHQIVAHGPNDYSIDYTILGPDTPGITSISDLFTVVCHGDEDGEAVITIVEADLRDLQNQSVPVACDQTGTVIVDCGPPAAVTDLEAASGHQTIIVTWQDPGDPFLADIKIFRGCWTDAGGASAYPRYGRLEGASTPERPATLAEATDDPRWTLVSVVEAGVMTYTDAAPERGVYFYEVFPRNGLGDAGPPATEQAAATSYILGDVVDGGDGMVDVLDVSALGDAYATVEGDPAYDPVIDYGPTDDASGSGVPVPDGAIGFEEMVIVGLNFGPDVRSDDETVTPTEARFAWVDLGDGRHALHLREGLGVKAVRVRAAVGGGVGVSAGALLDDQEAPVFLRNAPSGLDAGLCLLGRGTSLVGTGELLVLSHTDETLAIEDMVLDVRGVDGAAMAFAVEGAVTAATVPTAFCIEGIYPNPFNPMTTIAYSLPRSSAVEFRIFDVRGRQVWSHASLGSVEAGHHSLTWHGVDDRGRELSSGTYLLKMRACGLEDTRRMTLVR